MLNIAIILGTVRPGRNGEAVAQWVKELGNQRRDASFELVDMLDNESADDPQKNWPQKISGSDAFIFVTPEYNQAISSALKSTKSFVQSDWVNKVAGFVSYGNEEGSRAVEQLRAVMAELRITDVRAEVFLSLASDFENYSRFTPASHHKKQLYDMIDQVIYWGEAMKKVRTITQVA